MKRYNRKKLYDIKEKIIYKKLNLFFRMKLLYVFFNTLINVILLSLKNY